MSSYRFCRSDDIPLLVDACRRCHDVHFPDETPLTLADFKRDVRELDLWCSSCMVAFADDGPIAVVLSAKREEASLIHRIGVRPDHQREGHGAHLLESLGRKLAILGPRRLVVEIPAEWTGVRRFFERCAYREERRYADFERRDPPDAPDAIEVATAVGLDELVESGALRDDGDLAWERALPTLRHRRAELDGFAIASDVRLEAWVVTRDRADATREILALGHAGDDASEALLGALVSHAGRDGTGMVVPRIDDRELPPSVLERWGFRRTREFVRMVATAQAG